MAYKAIRFILYLLAGIVTGLLLFLFIPPLYKRMVTYPKMQAEINAFQKMRKETAARGDLKLYRGVLHVHSYWSHDSRGKLTDIIPAAKLNGISFVFLTDHPHGNIDTLPRGYHGCYDGVLIESGSEKQGYDVWPLRPVVLDWGRNKDTIAMEVVKSGGLVFIAHPEEPRNWGNQWYQGMEIYNFHADTKDKSLIPPLANFIVNGRKYPQLSLREMFDEQVAILARWDSLNTRRKIVGISAVDTHENQNIRARYLSDGRIEWVGPDANVMDTTDVTFWNRWLLNPPDRSGWIFKWMIDTYREGFRYITNYVFADTLTTASIADHIRRGHLFSAFMGLGDAEGFMFGCNGQNGEQIAIMGDSISLEKVKYLSAVSPLPGKFRLIHNGQVVNISQENIYEYKWEDMLERGAYRMEVQIKLSDRDVPWIYSNPVYIY
jgi:hypothetical protein